MLNVKKLALIIATVAVTACTGSSGDKFVGKWINRGDPVVSQRLHIRAS